MNSLNRDRIPNFVDTVQNLPLEKKNWIASYHPSSKKFLPRDWTKGLEKMALDDFKNSVQSVGACVKEKSEKIKNINIILERLPNGYLEQDIEKETYRSEKVKLLSEKKSLEEEMTSLSHKQNDWLEPLPSKQNLARLRIEIP